MAFLAHSRKGVETVIGGGSTLGTLWVGAAVLSEAEIEQLRTAGIDSTVFSHPVRTTGDVENALLTIHEHHPNESVSAEGIPTIHNIRSADIGTAFLWQEYIVGVRYQHNEFVEIQSGPFEGERGSLVSLLTLSPEPTFILESKSGSDLNVMQSQIARPTDT